MRLMHAHARSKHSRKLTLRLTPHTLRTLYFSQETGCGHADQGEVVHREHEEVVDKRVCVSRGTQDKGNL